MKKFDAIIIGGGASGCMAAISALNGKKIAIIDSYNTPAKKILATGNGRCNLTNINLDNSFYNTDIQNYLSVFNNNDTISFFNKLGLLTYSDEEGRVYPFSNSAKTVVDIIEKELKNKGVCFYPMQTVCNIKKVDDVFYVHTENEIYTAPKVVVATGGNTMAEIIKSFNIKFVDNIPSLCALKTKSTKRLSGLKLSNVKVSAFLNDKTKQQMGEVLFKDSGLSGIVIFNLSTLFSRNNNFNGIIEIDLMPNYTNADIYLILNKKIKQCKTIKDLLLGIFNAEINKEILWRNNLKEEDKIEIVDTKKLKDIVFMIKHFSFKINGFYPNNQVYSGGVCLQELTNNLQSKKVDGLYFCGEVCNVDGECGGYNLQWAFSSGYIVGKNL